MEGQEPAVIKGDRDGLFLVIEKDVAWAAIEQSLRKRLKASPQFFRGAAVRLNPEEYQLSEAERKKLESLFREFGVYLVEPQRSTRVSSAKDVPAERPTSEAEALLARATASLVEQAAAEQAAGAQAIQSSSSDDADWTDEMQSKMGDPNTLLIKRTLRSGQSVAYDGNVVIRGDVNAGALVTCSGDIIVLGALRGVAHAGAEGDTEAVVIAFRLEPTQLRIAGHISRAPDGEYTRPMGPEVARVKEGSIQVETYSP